MYYFFLNISGQVSQVVFGLTQIRVGQQLFNICKRGRHVLKGATAIHVVKSGAGIL